MAAPKELEPVLRALVAASELQRIVCNNTGQAGAHHWQKVADEARKLLPDDEKKTDEKKTDKP